jgi:lysophospholipase L1-like esterase
VHEAPVMQYQNILCLGDSQTFGARSYGCYPLYLAQALSRQTPYQWRAINRSVNGYTARDLWFMANTECAAIADTFQACLLIGTNDVGNATPLDLFEEYYRQILRCLAIHRFKAVFCGEIPPIQADGHVFFPRASAAARAMYNQAIERVIKEFPNAVWVPMHGLEADCYVDPVHFNELGNQRVAAAFGNVIAAR